MKVTKTELEGVLLLEPRVFSDERGFFLESHNERDFAQATGINPHFVQDNHTLSHARVLRGLHYQIRQPQGKLVRVVSGEIYDVCVDLRRNSASFGLWTGVRLSAENRRMVWIPPGFAHGFLVLSDHADCLYKTTDYYSPAHERALLWNDPAIGIKWPLSGEPVMNARDREATGLAEAELFD